MTRYEPADWYRLPRYYDIVYEPGTNEEADFLQDVLEHHAGRAREAAILEPACGTGRLMAAMARRGHRVSGFDASEPMLAYARRRLRRHRQRAEIAPGRLEQFRHHQRFDMAHCLFSTFKYLPSEPAARSHLACVARVLRPGGIYLLGLHLSDYTDRRRSRERWVGRRGGVRVTCNVQEWPAERRRRRARVRSRLIVQQDGETRRYETNWHFRTYSRHQLERLLASVPELTHIATHDFRHDLTQPVALDDGLPDKVLVLRRTG